MVGESTMPEWTTDETDRQLIALLGQNARTPTAALARRLGLSRTTVQSRIERLERRGVIRGYTVRLAADDAAVGVRAHVMITVQQKKAQRVEAQLRRIPEIAALYAISGEFDMIAIVAAPTVADIDRIIDEIGHVDGIDRTLSSIILSAKFDR
jgi:DNA-binding Lrp family transcriptional regulator